MPSPIAGREQPRRRGPLVAPVRAERLEQTRREEGHAVAGSLALPHAKHAALGVDVADLKRDDLADAQTRRVGGEQQGPVLETRRAGEQPCELFAGENLRQRARLACGRDDEARAPASQGHVIEEAEPGHGHVAGAVTEPLLTVEMKQVRLDLPLRDAIGRTPVEGGEPGDDAEVGLLGVGGEPSEHEVIDHLLAKGRHVDLPGCAGHGRAARGSAHRRSFWTRVGGGLPAREPSPAPLRAASGRGPLALLPCRVSGFVQWFLPDQTEESRLLSRMRCIADSSSQAPGKPGS